MRPTPKRLVKAVFVVSVLGFVALNVNFLLRDSDDEEADEYMQPSGGLFGNYTATGLRRRKLRPEETQRLNMLSQLNKLQWPLAANVSRSNLTGKTQLSKNGNKTDIRSSIWEVNRQQLILNLDKFDLSASDSTVVIVVQVHNRPEYLRHLVSSLQKARDIEKTLVIFSHDFYSDELNEIIANIDFCPVMQIFYPYSMQLHPTEFPGQDPRDCPRDANREKAKELNCHNKDYPDKYGHYREAKYSQTKHHWFWKINHAFDQLDVMKNYDGPVLFIEEDHYLVEDFLPVLRMMYRLRKKACIDCNILTLGTYDKKPAYGSLSPKVDIMNWISSKHNMGMSLTRATWNQMKNCTEAFCRFDDYNWDWSLHYIGMTCIPTKLRVMVMKSPRIFHIGECGLHAKGKNCNPADRVRYIETLLSDNLQYLFPPALVVAGYPNVPRRVPKANGGWGDIRDHQLCISFLDKESHS